MAVYVGVLIGTVPASWADRYLEDISAGRIRLAGAQGTLWSGSGILQIQDAAGRDGISKALSWQMRAAGVLRGELVCDFRIDQSKRDARIVFSRYRVDIADMDLDLPARALALALPKLHPLQLAGDILVHTSGVSIGRLETRGMATLRWRNAGSTISTVPMLGEYEFRIEAQGNSMRSTLVTLDGPLRLTGNGTWQVGENPRFAGAAHVEADYSARLAPLLRLIAPQRSDGTFEILLR